MPLRAPPSSSPSFAIVHKASKNRTNYGMYSSPQCAPVCWYSSNLLVSDSPKGRYQHAQRCRPNAVRLAYTHGAEFWTERVQLMQAWADYLDGLREGGKVLPD